MSHLSSDSDAALARLRVLLEPSQARYSVTEVLRQGGGSRFTVDDFGTKATFSTADRPESATVISVTTPEVGHVINVTLTRDEAIALMAHLSEVTG